MIDNTVKSFENEYITVKKLSEVASSKLNSLQQRQNSLKELLTKWENEDFGSNNIIMNLYEVKFY